MHCVAPSSSSLLLLTTTTSGPAASGMAATDVGSIPDAAPDSDGDGAAEYVSERPNVHHQLVPGTCRSDRIARRAL